MSELDNTMVSIRISGQDMDPRMIGDLLCFKESKKTITTITRHISGIVHWSIMLKSKKRIPLEDKIESLFSNFTDDDDIWKQVTTKFNVDIYCGLFLEIWNEGFTLTPDLLKKISNRNLEIGFDVWSAYGPPDKN